MKSSTIDIQTALIAARSLALHLDEPSAEEFFAPGGLKQPCATLCRAPKIHSAIASPTALFSQMQMPVGGVPKQWVTPYRNWLERLHRTHQVTVALLRLNRGEADNLLITDPIAAGLILYLSSSAITGASRYKLLRIAVTAPEGAWLAGEGLHHPEEREAIVKALENESRLCWWISLVPGFAAGALQHSRGHLDIYGGMTIASHGNNDDFRQWLDAVGRAHGGNPDAAGAALVFQPTAGEAEKECWITSLQRLHASFQAYLTVRRAWFTWPVEQWEWLRESLRPLATARPRDRSFFHWYRDIEPHAAASVLGDASVDPLWAAELIDSAGIPDDFAFRFRMGEQLGPCGDPVASLVLAWLNRRLQPK